MHKAALPFSVSTVLFDSPILFCFSSILPQSLLSLSLSIPILILLSWLPILNRMPGATLFISITRHDKTCLTSPSPHPLCSISCQITSFFYFWLTKIRKSDLAKNWKTRSSKRFKAIHPCCFCHPDQDDNRIQWSHHQYPIFCHISFIHHKNNLNNQTSIPQSSTIQNINLITSLTSHWPSRAVCHTIPAWRSFDTSRFPSLLFPCSCELHCIHTISHNIIQHRIAWHHK